MQNIDSLKFEISRDLISFNLENYNKSVFFNLENYEKSINEMYDCEYTKYGLRDSLKQTGLNGIFINDRKCVIQISSKLVPEDYYNMINKNTVEKYFNKLNATGLIKFNVNTAIENSYVLSCDITNNIPNIENVATYINPLLIFKTNNKFICKHYNNESISFTRNVKNLASGEHLKLYDKIKELENPKKKENKDFLKTIDVENFRNVLRVESRFNNAKLMRKHFNVAGLSLSNILNSKEKINYNIFNKITDLKNIDINTYKNYNTLMGMREKKIRRSTIENITGKLAIIKMLNCDIELIRDFINTGSGKKSNNSATIKEYRRLTKSLNDVDKNSNVDERVNEIKEYLQVA